MTDRSAPLLHVRDLTVSYPRGRRRSPRIAVCGVDLSIFYGETLALVGESGSGKSTVGNAILGLVPAAKGTIEFAGEDITHTTVRRRRQLTRELQVVFQDPHNSLNPVRTVGQTLLEPVQAHGKVDAGTARRLVTAALESVGLDSGAIHRYPAQFSGGQRQRIAIARAVILRPQLIVCDEPTSALDLSVQAQVLNVLTKLKREMGVSYLFITHDLAVARHVADRVTVLKRGKVMETGPTAQICDRPQHPYTRALLAAVPPREPSAQHGNWRPRDLEQADERAHRRGRVHR